MQRKLKTRTPKQRAWPVIPATLAGMIVNVILNTAPADNVNPLFMQKFGFFGIFTALSVYWAIRTCLEHFEWANGKIVYYVSIAIFAPKILFTDWWIGIFR